MPQTKYGIEAQNGQPAAAQSWEERLGELDEALAEAWLDEVTLQLSCAEAVGDAQLEAELARANGRVAELTEQWDALMAE